MLAVEFTSELEALQYIESNKQRLFYELEKDEFKTIYNDSNTRIHITKNKKQLIKIINRFENRKNIFDICNEITHLLKYNHVW